MKATNKTTQFVRLSYENEAEKAEILGMIADTGMPIGRFVLKMLRNELAVRNMHKRSERAKKRTKTQKSNGAANG